MVTKIMLKKMNRRLPILITIPHGGITVPEELTVNKIVSKFDIFFESDTCANELFNFKNHVIAKIDTEISRLFIDLDRNMLHVFPISQDGVIKNETLHGKPIYKKTVYPDKIAIPNILNRYYQPFHRGIKKYISKGEIKLIIDCHTMMPVGPSNSPDAGMPRPLILVENIIEKDGEKKFSCPPELAKSFMENLKKSFTKEEATVAGKFYLNKPLSKGYLINKYGQSEIPMLRLSISRSLFLNDKYLNHDNLKVDEVRINELKKKIWFGINKFFLKYF